MSAQISLYKTKYEEQRNEAIKAHNALAILRSQKKLADQKIEEQQKQIQKQRSIIQDKDAVIKQQAETIAEQKSELKKEQLANKIQELNRIIQSSEEQTERLQVELRYEHQLRSDAEETIKKLRSYLAQSTNKGRGLGNPMQPKQMEENQEETIISRRFLSHLKRPREQYSFEEDYKNVYQQYQLLKRRYNEALADINRLKYNTRTNG